MAIAIPFFLVGGEKLGWVWPSRKLDGFLDLTVFGAALLGFLILFGISTTPFVLLAKRLFGEPNKSWHRKNGPDVPRPVLPNVTAAKAK